MIKIDEYTVLSHAEDPSLAERSYQDFRASWPEFMLHSPLALRSKQLLMDLAPAFQFFVVDDSGNVLTICRSVPMFWAGTIDSLPMGYDAARIAAIQGLQESTAVNTLLGLSITVPGAFRSKGLSSVAIKAMKAVCIANRLDKLIVPVRPSQKDKYPLTPITEYVEWKDPDGSAFDPWLRAHIRLGAEVLGCSAESMKIQGTVEEWESWTRLRFPQSGDYIISGGGSPLKISRESNTGIYYDPNVWVAYHFGSR